MTWEWGTQPTMALALAISVLSFAASTTGSLLYIGFGTICTLNHYLGLGLGTATAGYISHWAYNDYRKKEEPIHNALAGAVVSMPLSFIIGYGVPYVFVPFALGMYVLYLAGEVEVVWTPNEKYIGLKNQDGKTTGGAGNGFTIGKKEKDYTQQVLDRLLKSDRNEPSFTHKYSDADYKRIPEEEFAQIWIDAANDADRRLRQALRAADRADQAAEVAKNVADLGIDADVQEDNTGQFIVYTGVSDAGRRNEIEAKALAVFEGGEVGEDNDGQFVIYTGIGGTEEEEPAAAKEPNSEEDVFEADPDSPITSPPVVVPEYTKRELAYSLRSRSSAAPTPTETAEN